ncbi:alpha/beta fold hydrolase [Streptomyces sp. NPDC060194]|uniref:alpha/beta fold hydrolase n=1 Tax=Streptomyces sp. NPDC060194 TaxID=3347069 RepID=UPI003662CA7F
MSRPATFSPPSGVSSRVLPTARGEFAALDTGAGPRGTVLLVPGYTGSKEDFISLLPPLAEAGYRAVAVDGRGQYESPWGSGELAYSRAELAADLLAQAAALDTPLHLVGHSLGGQISRAAVLTDPAPFRTLTLMSSGPAEISPDQQDRVKLLQDALAAMPMDAVWEAIQATGTPEDTETDSAALRARWLRNDPRQLIATGHQLRTEPDLVDALAAVGLPLHVLSGETDDTWPVPWLDAMAARLSARRTAVPGADHSPNTDRPAATAAALLAFFAAHPA